MNHPLNSVAISLGLLLALSGCALPNPAPHPVVYDFGPGALSAPARSAARHAAPLAVAEIEVSPALDSSAVLYRLAYADAQQLKAYTQARWSMTPAQLLGQRLREQLGQRRAALNPGEGSAVSAPRPLPAALTLRVELQEFSHLFETPQQSAGLLRLHATLTQASRSGETALAQTSVIVQRPAATPDASGGVRALTAAADAAVQELDEWLGRMMDAAR